MAGLIIVILLTLSVMLVVLGLLYKAESDNFKPSNRGKFRFVLQGLDRKLLENPIMEMENGRPSYVEGKSKA